MLIMAEVSSEMGAELRASAIAAGTSVAAEVGRRLERLDRLEATVEAGSNADGLGSVHPVRYREVPDGIDDTATDALMRHYRNKEALRRDERPVAKPSAEERAGAKARCLATAEALIRQGRQGRDEESLYSGSPNPWDMFRSSGGGR